MTFTTSEYLPHSDVFFLDANFFHQLQYFLRSLNLSVNFVEGT
jgi:hypothetical protein